MGVTLLTLILRLYFFKCFAFFKFNMLDKNVVLTREKIGQLVWRKSFFLVVIKINFFFFFFIINSVNQELINHIHCLDAYFIIKARQRNLVYFTSFCSMIFTLNRIYGNIYSETFTLYSESYLSQTFLIQQNIFVLTMTYCCDNIFVCTICLFILTTK